MRYGFKKDLKYFFMHRDQFLTNYVMQQRQEIAGDKASLNQLYLAKGAILAAITAAIGSDNNKAIFFIFAFTPFIFMQIDYLYKKRLNEIFRRWDNLQNNIIPMFDCLDSSSRDKLFEKTVKGMKNAIYKEERVIKSSTLFPTIVVAPTFCGLYAASLVSDEKLQTFAFGAAVNFVLLFVCFQLLFDTNEYFENTYSTGSVYFALLLSITCGFIVGYSGLVT